MSSPSFFLSFLSFLLSFVVAPYFLCCCVMSYLPAYTPFLAFAFGVLYSAIECPAI